MGGGGEAGGLECGYGSWTSSECCGQRPWESAVGGLHGRQRQDAAIVGVEVLCVAPRPGNRQ